MQIPTLCYPSQKLRLRKLQSVRVKEVRCQNGLPLKLVRSIFMEVCSSDKCERASQTSDIEATSGVVMKAGSM